MEGRNKNSKGGKLISGLEFKRVTEVESQDSGDNSLNRKQLDVNIRQMKETNKILASNEEELHCLISPDMPKKRDTSRHIRT